MYQKQVQNKCVVYEVGQYLPDIYILVLVAFIFFYFCGFLSLSDQFYVEKKNYENSLKIAKNVIARLEFSNFYVIFVIRSRNIFEAT